MFTRFLLLNKPYEWMLCFLAGIFAGHDQPNLIIVPMRLIAREMLQLPLKRCLWTGSAHDEKIRCDSRRLWNLEYNEGNQYCIA